MNIGRFELLGETKSNITFNVKLPSLRYLDEFIRLKCASSLLNIDIFPNVKEITESMTAFSAVRKYLGAENFGNKNITLFDIASGRTPRTASLFAHMTNWNCHAIDPILKNKTRFLRTRNLSLHSCRIQDFDNFSSEDIIVITAVHAHVSLETIVKKFHSPRLIIIAMPCCRPLKLECCEPVVQFDDLCCLSPKRRVKIFDILEDMRTEK